MIRPMALASILATLAIIPATAKPCIDARSAPQQTELNGKFFSKTSYDPGTTCLYVFFKDGSIYSYPNVPAQLYGQLAANSDPGSFFNKEVRDKFGKPLKIHARTEPLKPKALRRPSFKCVEPTASLRRHVNSVILDFVAYDLADRCLILYFDHRGVYQYGNVPPATFRALVGAKDVDHFFNAKVRNNYPHRPSGLLTKRKGRRIQHHHGGGH
jgi:hypothetical protein